METDNSLADVSPFIFISSLLIANWDSHQRRFKIDFIITFSVQLRCCFSLSFCQRDTKMPTSVAKILCPSVGSAVAPARIGPHAVTTMWEWSLNLPTAAIVAQQQYYCAATAGELESTIIFILYLSLSLPPHLSKIPPTFSFASAIFAIYISINS